MCMASYNIVFAAESKGSWAENLDKAMLKTKHILDALKTVKAPQGHARGGADIVSAGMVSGVQCDAEGQVLFMIEVDPKTGPQMEPLRQEAEAVVNELRGVKKVTAVLTAEKVADMPPANDPVPDLHGMSKNPPLKLPIKNIIAVASGKGGVGKSTIASAIARNLAENSQLKIGLLDADIYGPSQPKLMGLESYKPSTSKEEKITPASVKVDNNGHDLKVMSIGFMVDAAKALVWRGPMVQSAIYQLFRDVQWADIDEKGHEDPLDILVVDMPPGTGDAQLTLAQKVPVTGAIIVSTPQDIALADARKAVEMFQATNVPILGIIENMSTHICTNCGHEEHVFGHGGAREEAEKLDVPFLGELPLSADIRAKSDAGLPTAFPSQIVEKLLKTF